MSEATKTVRDGVVGWTWPANISTEFRVWSAEQCRENGIAFTDKQRAAYDAHLDQTMREYAEARANRTAAQKAEEMADMRAAFGAGVKVVNVFTGEEFSL